MTDPRRVLHVIQTWGVPSQTFVRSAIRDTPVSRTALLCVDVEPGASPFAGPVIRVGRTGRLVPSVVRGKVYGALGLAAAALTKADVVHAHMAHQLRLAAAIARSTRRPLVVSVYGRDLLVELQQDPEGVGILQGAAAVIALSGYLAGEVGALGVAPERIAVVPLGIDPEEFPVEPGRERRVPAPSDPLRVLFVGRFVGKKGVIDALDAIETASSRGVEIVARFLGSGELEPAMRTRIGQGPLADRVTIEPGERPAVRSAFRWADVVFSPSCTDDEGDRDTLLVVNMEAQACGVPVITTRVGGVPEGVAPGAGVLLEEGDVAGFAEALGSLAGEPDRRVRMGRAGERWIADERLSTHTGRRLAAVYDAVVERRSVPRSP